MDLRNNMQLQRVWSRVQGRETVAQDAASVAALYMAEQISAAGYLYLSKSAGPAAEKYYQLYRQEQAMAAALRGICVLLTEEKPQTPGFVPQEGQIRSVLRRCYVEELRRGREYAARSNDPEYGMAFAKMERKKQEHCCMVLELIGML